MAEIHKKLLYEMYLEHSYMELEESLLYSKDQDEKNFYAVLCQFYLSSNQKRVMEEHPY